MSIKVENVSYTYSAGTPLAKDALHNISLEIEDGAFVGLIGHTGSGKSTLIQHFNGLIKPTSGKVFIDGVEITAKKVNLRLIRRKVGMVFQYPEHQLFGETVLEDVAFGPRNAGLDEGVVEQRVKDALAMVDLDYQTLKERSPFELSGGQKRRVAIAGVLAMKPSILVLDEPTAGLDPRGRDDVLAQIGRLHKEWDLTVVLVSHSMEDVARLATRMIVMHNGEITLDGRPNEVFTHGDLLREIGLGVPQITELMHELRKQGLEVRTDILTLDEAEKEISRILESKTHGHI